MKIDHSLSPWRLNLSPQKHQPHEVLAAVAAQGEHLVYRFPPVNSLAELPLQNLVGFVYRITDRLTGKIYIGKKSLVHATKRKATKKEVEAARQLKPTGRKKVVRGTKESDWRTYWGSCQELKQDVQLNGAERYVREIIVLCCSKSYLAYAELDQMFKHRVLELGPTQCYNDNIAGKYFRKTLLNCPEQPGSETND